MKKILHLVSFFVIFLFKTGIVTAQGGDNCVAASGSPITLPFTAISFSTCPVVDDYNAPLATMAVPTCIDPSFTQGKDWLYYFTATVTGPVLIQLANVNAAAPAISFPSISVWSGCPGAGGTCVGGIGSMTGILAGIDSLIMQFNATSLQPYYVMIDCDPQGGPVCISYDISISNTPAPPIQPICTNMDFEQGNFNGWYGTSGRTTISCGAAGALRPDYDLGVPGFTNGYHAIMSGAGIDTCSGIPVVCPAGGNFSVKLGDDLNCLNGSATLEQTFNVTSANAYLTYWYAVLVQSGKHSPWVQPFFQIEVLDCNGNKTPCGQYLVVGDTSLPGFYNSVNCGIYYKGWTPVAMDLSSQIGSCVTVRFIAGDCCQGGHCTYAYIDLESCKPVPILANNSICAGQSATLTAPYGFLGYSWSTGATTSAITVSPTVQTTYTVTLTSVSGPGCVTILTDTVFISPFPTALITCQNVCGGNSATLTASGGTNYLWSNGAVTNSITVSPTATTTYSVIVSAGSCSDTKSCTVNVFPAPVVSAASNVTITPGQSATLTATGGGGTYSWSNGSTGSIITVAPLATTPYCVTITDTNGCSAIACVTVTIEDSCSIAGAGEFYLPNAFSPNNDGENDEICLQGGIQDCIKELKIIIYDRWGEKVYKSNDKNFCWDGTYQAKILNTAVFVYYLNATLISGDKIIRKGNISLLR